jgi:queuine tRNA-ribosyltransferase
MCEFTTALMPADKPRYMMGVGTPLDILEGVHRGVDMFDCIIPTQVAQRGGVFTSRGYLQMRRSVYKYSEEKLDPTCGCPTCARYSRSYLHHLTKTKETLGWQLLGKHNIHFYHQLMREIRGSILEDRFLDLYNEKRQFLHAEDLDNPVPARPRKGPKRLVQGDYEIHTAWEGFSSIRHISSGEIMHSRTPPMEEARQLYIEQSRLRERLADNSNDEPLVVWDVGLGAGANAMAAIGCYEQIATEREVRPLTIVSFENDLDSLRLAFRNNELFPYLRHSGPSAILKVGEWESKIHPRLQWKLVNGDFLETLSEPLPSPDLIFYDMFSTQTCQEAWTTVAFRKIMRVCQGRPMELFTYTCSTASRVAMLAAGLWVASGRNAGEKLETTIAFTPEAFHAGPAAAHDLLGVKWLEKWKRSGAKYPLDVTPENEPEWDRLVLDHPQFRWAG